MNELAEKIAYAEESIYLVHGSENTKEELKRAINEYAGGIVTIPKFFLEVSPNPDDEDQYDLYLDSITVRIMIADFFIIYLDNFDSLSGERLKELVSDELFSSFYYIIMGKNCPSRKRKLIIVTELDFNKSIFTRDAGLNSRCKIF